MSGIFYRVCGRQIGKGEIVQCDAGTMTAREALLHAILFFVADDEDVQVGDEIEVYGPYPLPEPQVVFSVTRQDLKDADNL